MRQELNSFLTQHSKLDYSLTMFLKIFYPPKISLENRNWFLTILRSRTLALGMASKSAVVNGEKTFKNKNFYNILCD